MSDFIQTVYFCLYMHENNIKKYAWLSKMTDFISEKPYLATHAIEMLTAIA